MRVLMLINTSEYRYHEKFAEIISELDEVSSILVIDFAKEKIPHITFGKISDADVDIIINLDLVGFSLLTESDSISLNDINTRIVNILFHNNDFYGKQLKYRQNLSMFTYFSSYEKKDLKEIKKEFRNIPNAKEFCEFDYKNIENSCNICNLQKWIGHMKEDVRI